MLGTRPDSVVVPVDAHQRTAAAAPPEGSLTVEAVPPAHKPQPVPIMRLILPIVMVVGMVGMVVLMVIGAGPDRNISPMMLMFPLMMLMSVAAMFGTQPANEDPDEVRRTYLRHIAQVRDEALANAKAQRQAENWRHPDPRQIQAWAGTPRLWERSSDCADALEVRIGTGPAALCTPLEVPDPGETEGLDPVCAVSVRHLVAAVSAVPGIPVVLQLQAFNFLGLAGPAARGVARALVNSLVCAHGPETVSVSVIGRTANGDIVYDAATPGWEWIKWLPHSRNKESATFQILLVDSVPTTGLEDFIDSSQWTTIVDVCSLRSSALGVLAEHEGLRLWAGDELRVVTAAGEEVLGEPDILSATEMAIFARSLARFRRPENATHTRGETSGDLLEMLGIGSVDNLKAENMWPGYDGSSSRLAVPIGLSPDKQPVRLDFKESAQGGMGPHGLCIGATGSGKSEVLRTVVAALAATHSPHELNFVLVDFKGGATFLGCEDLPHTSAVITNLEEESILVDRMFDAISGEMQRRQHVLREAGNFANVTDYTAARNLQLEENGHTNMEPLPALMIIVDEFSELLGHHPDFAELFVAVGRLGRSLHVHLLLASQRLEEGRLRGLDSHLSYRIGLKTFSAGESRQVLGVPDAYHLPAQPGAGYLKADSKELQRFQGAYVSGPVRKLVVANTTYNRDKPQTPPPLRVEIFADWMKNHDTPEEQVEEKWEEDQSTTLLKEVVHASKQVATLRGQKAHNMWLPPLPASVPLPNVVEDHGHLQCAIGIIDRPFQQRQDPYILNLGVDGGHLALCGGPQSGKSNALRSLVTSLAATHSPENIRFYVLDLAGGQLASLARLPHVAGVAQRDESEKVRRVVDEVSGFIENPEHRHTFLIIDGWHHIGNSNADYEELVEVIARLVVDGPGARVHVCISTGRWTTIRPAVRDHISHRIELHLAEPLDSLIDRKKQEKLPSLPGRGLTTNGESMLLAHSSNQDIAHVCSQAERAGLSPVPRLKMLPECISVSDLKPVEHGLPFAIGGRDMGTVVWHPRGHGHFMCVGSSGSGKSTWVRTLLSGISSLGKERARIVLIDHRRAHLGQVKENMLAAYSASSEATEQSLASTVVTLSERLPGADVTPEQLAARSWWEGPDIYIVIDDADLVSEMAVESLIPLLPHARDIGLHLILARKSGGIGRAMFNRFFSAVKDLQPAVLVLDADRDEGAIFGIKPVTLPPGRGTYLARGHNLGLIHIAQAISTTDNVLDNNH